ncbi:myosin light chain kinase, smooth muscle-like isoform 2-T4 [Spinachia spinachia]
MDPGGGKPKTFMSTFRLAFKPKARRVCVEKQRENGADATRGTNTKVVSSTAGSRPTNVQALAPPHFSEALRECSVREGRDASFQGVVTGSRPLGISWLHNGKKRMPSSNTSFHDGVATLTLTQCSRGDAGAYTCEAENAAGKRSSSGVLHVTDTKEVLAMSSHDLHSEDTCPVGSPEDIELPSASGDRRRHREEEEEEEEDQAHLQTKGSSRAAPPVEFVDPPEPVEVRVGEQARLRCAFRSSSVPVACCWIYKKYKVVAAGPRISVRSSETQSVVEISAARPEDTGSYTVVVRTARGSAQHTIPLRVIERPAPPASPPVISQLCTGSLVLSWTGPSYDGGTPVLGYKVEVREEQDEPESWTVATGLCESTSYHVRSGLRPLGRYRFRVRAFNAAGLSEPSQESQCVRMATPKEKKEESESCVTVTIDTKNKVQDYYDVHEKLGSGKFGQVFRMSHKDTGRVVAGKFYRARTSKERTAARREMTLMNRLHHPKLVQCLAAFDSRSEVVMVLEYIAGGELFERIVDDNFEHTEPTSAHYMQQILEGMQYVHKQNIVHLDLKPENIVCVDTTGTRIKIIDFGLASELEEGKPLLVMHGTPEFVAPEVINYEPVGLETDIWSIGVICFILLSGESPFQGNNDNETLALVTAAQFEFDEESFEDISDEAKDFIGSLLKKNRRCRLSCAEALAHPWMASFPPMNRRPTKSLNKGKMKLFLARRKWKKTGKAVLALQRMANLSNRPDSPGNSSEEPGWSQEAEEAIQSLDKQLQREPRFQQVMRDTTLPRGATARLACLVNGYPLPETKWLLNEEPVSRSCRVTVQQQEDGLCSLVVAELRPSDSGVYVCRASNGLGEATCSAKLTVEM